MPDNIERTIYKLDMDDSGYIRGVDRITTSTENFSRVLQDANTKLQQNREALRVSTENLARQRQELENANRSNNVGIIQARERAVKKAEEEQNRLNEIVKQSQVEYDKAAEAAKRFDDAKIAAAQTTPAVTPSGQPLSISSGAAPIPEITENIRELLQLVESTSPEAFANVLLTTAENMDHLRLATEHAEEELAKMVLTDKVASQEFKDLSAAVSAAHKLMDEFKKATKENGVEQTSYKTQISNARLELQKLEVQGKQNTQEYIDQEKKIVALTRAYNDQRQRIRILASETRALDFGKATIQTALTGFKALTSTQILFGNASEETQKKVFKLFAAMELLNSVEQLNNQLKAVSVIRTNAQSASTAAYTAIVGSATGATRAFRLALSGAGIGLVIAGIAAFIIKLQQLRKEEEEEAARVREIKEIHDEAAKSVGNDVAKLELLRTKLTDLSIPQKQRIEYAKQYNKLADEANKIDDEQINNLDLINQKIDAQNKLILQRAIALAATAKLGKAAAEFVDAQLELDRIASTTKLPGEQLVIEQARLNAEEKKNNDELEIIRTKRRNIDQLSQKERQTLTANERVIITNLKSITKERQEIFKGITIEDQVFLNQVIKTRNEKRDELEKQTKLLSPLIKSPLDFGAPPPPPKTIDNVFDEEKQRLLDRLEQLRIDELTGTKKINDEFVAKFQKEQQRIAKLLADKKVTSDQARVLIDLAAQINSKEFEKAVEDFTKKVTESRIKLNEQLRDLQFKNTQDQINLLQDEFDRRRKLIEFNEQREIDQVRSAGEQRLKEFEEQQRIAGNLGLGDEAAAQRRISIAEETEQEITNITLRAAQERGRLAADIFKKSLERFDQAISESSLINDKAALSEIQALVFLFQQGKISYENYKKDLEAIQKKYEDRQLNQTIDTLEKEIVEIRVRLGTKTDITKEEYDALIKLVEQKEKELIAARIKAATGGVTGDKNKEVERAEDYVEAIGALTQSVIQFWVGANEAEEKALERSIALQERRVQEATRIAERGNASYLKLEEDRLKQLQVARENAARREIAVNAALQGSQILVSITGAIAKLASSPTPLGAAQVIAQIAVITSALAAGFALVKTLQNNQPKFAGGEKYVRRKNNEPTGIDTIPAWLTEGEAVISKDKNREYHTTVSAIHDGTVPASYLNKQVERYQAKSTDRYFTTEKNNFREHIEKYHTNSIKPVPQPHYEKIKETAEYHINSDGKLAKLISDQNRKIEENNDLQRAVVRAIKNIHISANVDRDGIAIAVNDYIEQMKIDRYT